MNIYDYYVSPEEYETAERNGIDSENVDRRIRLLGWSKKEAITKRKESYTDRKKWAKVAERNGIKYATFMNRINNLKWGEEKAATEPLNKHQFNGIYEPNRKIPKEIIELAKKNGIKYHTLRSRIKSGWDEVNAATAPLVSKSEAGKRGAAAYHKEHGRFHELIFK